MTPADLLDSLMREGILSRRPRGTISSTSSPTPTTPTPPEPERMDIPPPDDPLLSYFKTSIMHNGQGASAARRTSRVLLHLHTLTGRAPPMPILRRAIALASPSVKVVSERRGSTNIYRPRALSEQQRTRFALRWIKEASDHQPGRTVEERLARELIAIVKGTSGVLKKKLSVHQQAMINRNMIR
ncbi:ribosomal protein S7 [Rickenella mellea]|uniref:Ribosomal protein S7 n=1 Tax=Rickenella mellea TaxID=50990 RepID=A0A4Y7Q0V2_9AGAM|nr:ribosomal protein S7 [Rickenella mellea]